MGRLANTWSAQQQTVWLLSQQRAAGDNVQ